MKMWRVIFDYDDTLIRHDNDKEIEIMLDYLNVEATEEIKAELINYYTNLGICFGNKRVTKTKVTSYMYSALPLLNRYGITAQRFMEAQQYKDMNHKMLMDGAIDVLEYLKSKGYLMCVFTNWFRDEQVFSMKAQGVYDYFDRFYCWDDYYAKPDSRAYLRALGGTSPEENCMVGNSIENDIIPAKKLGIYTFGYNLNKEGGIMPDVHLKALSDLKNYL